MSRTPYNPVLHTQIPKFQEADKGVRLQEWKDWLTHVLRKKEIIPSPAPLSFKSLADQRAWSWTVKGLAQSFDAPLEIWRKATPLLPPTLPWDAKVQDQEPWLWTVLMEAQGGEATSLAAWIQASLESRTKTPEYQWLKSKSEPMSPNADGFNEKMAHRLLALWIQSISSKNGKEFNRWTPLVEYWTHHLSEEQGRFIYQVKHACMVRELLLAKHQWDERLPEEVCLSEKVSRLPEMPVFEKLFWQESEKIKPQWYATWEVALSTVQRFPLHQVLDREKPWLDTLNSLALDRGSHGPHVLPIANDIWKQLSSSLNEEDRSLWEKMWLNARIKSEPVEMVKTVKKRL